MADCAFRLRSSAFALRASADRSSFGGQVGSNPPYAHSSLEGTHLSGRQPQRYAYPLPSPSEAAVLTVTRDMVLPTTITGSYPRPIWFDRSLAGRAFKSALGDSLFREQYLDAVASIIAEQEAAGLDIVTDGDSRFDLTVGGKSWFFYPIERLGGVCGHRDTSRGWMSRHSLRPGKILWEVQEAYQPGVVREKLTRGPLEYAALWQVAQRTTDRPVKFGAICAPALASMLWNEFYDDDKA